PATLVSHLSATDPASHEALHTTIAGIYYLNPEVRKRIGYDGQDALPVTPDRYPAYLADGLLDHLFEDGWRERWEAGASRRTPAPASLG
ncbi:MAG TPA: hypothetical protein VI199_07975, partial [Novosphingobium sp.]